MSNQILAYTSNIIDTEAGSIDFGLIECIEKVPGLIQSIVDLSVSDNVFMLDNRSKWTPSNMEMIKNWRSGDELLITQNHAFFSVHRFALVNFRLQKAVPISLLREPYPVPSKTLFILGVDLSNDIITLDNGADYSVEKSDHGTLRRFSENDRVMLGINSTDKLDEAILEHGKRYLLIDTSCNSYIRVSPVR